MRVVLGLSLTATSAVWALVDTYDGSIVADELVALDSVEEIARAAARSVQSFALQTDRDIDGVRLVWDDSDATARRHGIRLRTKLRLFGFETVETVSEEAAREGRNRTARHIAPHMVLAYGAARADLDDTESRGVLRRIAARVPRRMPVAAPMRLAAAASVAVIALTGVVLYVAIGGTPTAELPGDTVPDNTVAEATLPAPAAVPVAPVAEPPAAQAAPLPAAVPEALTEPEPVASLLPATSALPETAPVPDAEQLPGYAAVPDLAPAEPITVSVAEPPAAGLAEQPGATLHGADAPTPQQVASVTGQVTGQPHLSGTGPEAGPVQPVAAPVTPAAPVATAPAAPAAPPGPLGALFRALP
ncbi:hypothetical protein ACNUDN_14180 [Mycobacterium sp. smrl_JER01]|uniref:hypothetical protein n=1 Tax=Mycobacterium sp. smrl_JER01 TaxID=3402633 RepID=UPI003AC85405